MVFLIVLRYILSGRKEPREGKFYANFIAPRKISPVLAIGFFFHGAHIFKIIHQKAVPSLSGPFAWVDKMKWNDIILLGKIPSQPKQDHKAA